MSDLSLEEPGRQFRRPGKNNFRPGMDSRQAPLLVHSPTGKDGIKRVRLLLPDNNNISIHPHFLFRYVFKMALIHDQAVS